MIHKIATPVAISPATTIITVSRFCGPKSELLLSPEGGKPSSIGLKAAIKCCAEKNMGILDSIYCDEELALSAK